MRKHLRTFEHRRETAREMADKVGLPLERFVPWLRRVASDSNLISFDGHWVETGAYVGVVIHDEVTLEVLPKLVDFERDGQSYLLSNLTYLLAVTDSGFDLDPYPATDSHEVDLFDALAHQFGRLLRQAIAR